MTIDELKLEAQTIQDYLDIESSNDTEEMADRIRTLMSYTSRSGFMLAEAKRILRRQKTSEINKTIIKIAKESCLSATVQNALLESICTEEAYLVDWLDRINRACVHQIDGLRSLLSFEKEELRLRNTGY